MTAIALIVGSIHASGGAANATADMWHHTDDDGDNRFLPVLGATIALAVVTNSSELLRAAGLPMAFTKVLTPNPELCP